MQPQILKEVRHSLSAEVLEERKPLAMSHMDIDQEHFKKVHEAMYQVVYGDNASARKAQPETIEIAGKTGTAQRYYYVNVRDSQGKILKDSKGKNKTKRQKLLYTWFTSFAPYNDPEYVLTIMIEEGQSGGSTCAPLAKKFYNEFFGASE